MDVEPEERHEVEGYVSYGQFCLLSEGHNDPETADVSELSTVASDGDGFGQSLGILVVLVYDFPDLFGELRLSIERWSRPAPIVDGGGFAGQIVIGSSGLVLHTMDADSRIDVAPGSYDIRVSHRPSPSSGEITCWSVQLFEVSEVTAPAPRHRRISLSRDQKLEQIMGSLPHAGQGGAWWHFPKGRLDAEYDEILWEIAPSIAVPTIANLHRSGITCLPRWLTRVPLLFGLLAHSNDIDKLPEWLPELGNLRRLTVSDNHRLTEVPDSLAQIPYLNYLELDGTGIDRVPNVVRHMPCLDRLNLSDTAVTGLPEWLGEVGSLTCLDLRSTKIQQFPASIQVRVDAGLLTINGD